MLCFISAECNMLKVVKTRDASNHSTAAAPVAMFLGKSRPSWSPWKQGGEVEFGMALVFILNGEKRKHSEQLEWFLWGGKLIKEMEF